MAASLVGLAAVVALLPFLGDERISSAEWLLSYLLAIVPSGVLVYGLFSPSWTRACPRRLLLLGAVLGAGSALAA